MPKDHQEDLKNDIRFLHWARNENEFQQRLNSFKEKWNKEKTNTFYKYMKKVWFNSSFVNWKIFNSPPGFSKTNSPIVLY